LPLSIELLEFDLATAACGVCFEAAPRLGDRNSRGTRAFRRSRLLALLEVMLITRTAISNALKGLKQHHKVYWVRDREIAWRATLTVGSEG
jgi:hypothetical protein